MYATVFKIFVLFKHKGPTGCLILYKQIYIDI